MTKKEIEKRLQEVRDIFGEWEYFEKIEAEYVELIYEIWEEANKEKEENNDTK